MRADTHTIKLTCDNCRAPRLIDRIRGLNGLSVTGTSLSECLTKLRDLGWYVGRRYHRCPACAVKHPVRKRKATE